MMASEGKVKKLPPSPGGLGSPLGDALRALRPHQWLKNVLIGVPAIAAHQTALEPIGQLLLAAIVFSLCASAGYVLNDLFDREHDRKHPRKKNRPFAAGALSPIFGAILSIGLLIAALTISIVLLPRSFSAVLCGYFALTLFYSAYLKQLLMIDVVVLACLYGLRVVAGGVAIGIPLSEWLIAFCIFFFISLALVKRSAEIKSALEVSTQLPGRGYKTEDLPIVLALAGASGFVSVLVLALYLDSENVRAMYSHPTALWGVGLVLVFWIGRVVLIAGRGDMHDDPVVFAVTDKISLLSAMAAGAVLILSV